MNLKEYEKIKNLKYSEYVDYLNKKYSYIDDKSKISEKGLFKHHIWEDLIPDIPNQNEIAINEYLKDYKRNKIITDDISPNVVKSEIVPCNYLEHLMCHVLIAEECDNGLGLGGAICHIIPEISDYREKGDKKYKDVFYKDIDFEAFDLLRSRCDDRMRALPKVFEHNQVLLKSVIEMLATKDRALILLGTGLGKTSTALAYLRYIQSDKRALVLVPNKTIYDTWSKYPAICKPMTIQDFTRKYRKINFSEYSLLIVDEAHHVEADEWGKGINYVLENHLLKVLGLTATPDRTDGTDIRETIFKDCVCEGKSVDQGIDEGLIFPFSYVTSIYDSPEKLRDEYGDCTDKTLVGQLDIELQKMKTVKDILHENMPDGKRKGIVFIQSTDDDSIDTYKKFILDAYPDAEFRIMLSSMNDNEIESSRKWFKETDSGYLICYNMMNEGAHYDGVNTIIMFRKTGSYLVFMQQIGRIITLTTKENPHAIVFDFVNNSENILKPSYTSEIFNRTKKILMKKSESKSEQVIVSFENESIVDVIRRINDYDDWNWEDWEIEILKKYYVTEGAVGCQKRIDEEWERRYPGSLTKE